MSAKAIILGIFIIGGSFSAKGHSDTSDCITMIDSLTNRELFILVDSMPEFPSGETAWLKYLSTNLRYPRHLEITGTVYISFIVETDGRLTSFNVLKSLTKRADDAALDVLRNMPHWTPGSCQGTRVAVRIILPIKFTWDE